MYLNMGPHHTQLLQRQYEDMPQKKLADQMWIFVNTVSSAQKNSSVVDTGQNLGYVPSSDPRE